MVLKRRVKGSTLPRSIHGEDGSVDAEGLDQDLREIERRLDEVGETRSNTPPKIKLELNQAGNTGILTAIVADPGFNWEEYVRFKKLSGPGDFDATDPEDGTWTTDTIAPFTETVTLAPKHGGIIAVAAPWKNLEGDLLWVIAEHRFDSDHDAELTGPAEVFFDEDGIVGVNVVGDEDAVKHYFRVEIGTSRAAVEAALTDPTPASNDGVLSVRQGTLVFDGVAATLKQAPMGRICGVRIASENAAGEVNSEVFGTFFALRGDSRYQQPRIRVQASRSGSSVTVVLEVDDPTLAAQEPEFKARHATPGGVLDPTWDTAWDSSTGVAGTDDQLERQEIVTSEPGLDGEFFLRVPWTDELGVTRYVGHTIALSNLEERTITRRIAFGDFKGLINTTEYSVGAFAYLHPNQTAAASEFMSAAIYVSGVTITEFRLRGYRQNSTSTVSGTLRRVGSSGSSVSLGTVSISATTAWETVAAALSEPTTGEGYIVTLSMRSSTNPDDAQLAWVEIVHSAPSYEFSL